MGILRRRSVTLEVGGISDGQLGVLEYDASHITDKYIGSRFEITGNSNPFELRRCHKN